MSIDSMLSDLSTKITDESSTKPTSGIFSIDEIIKSTPITTPIPWPLTPETWSQNRKIFTHWMKKYLSGIYTIIVIILLWWVLYIRYPIEVNNIIHTLQNMLSATYNTQDSHTAAPEQESDIDINTTIDTTPTPISDSIIWESWNNTIVKEDPVPIDNIFTPTIDIIRQESKSPYDISNTALGIRYKALIKQLDIYDTLSDEWEKQNQEKVIQQLYNSIISIKWK